MMRMRFPAAASFTALILGAAAPAFGQQSQINDIQVSYEGETVSILVKLSRQPTAAAAVARGDDLIVEIDGARLTALSLDPPAGSLVRHVEAAGNRLTLSGAAFADASTVIYRNAVLIETRLAEPEMRGSSLLAATPEQTPAGSAKIESLESVEPPVSASQPQSHPESPAAMAGLDSARCAAAALEFDRDPWALEALGDHALCLIDAGKTDEARNRLDQLAAFAPDDSRVVLGRSALKSMGNSPPMAEAGYRKEASLGPADATPTAVTNRSGQPGGN